MLLALLANRDSIREVESYGDFSGRIEFADNIDWASLSARMRRKMRRRGRPIKKYHSQRWPFFIGAMALFVLAIRFSRADEADLATRSYDAPDIERAAQASATDAAPEKPSAEKPADEQPAGEKPAGQKPAGEKTDSAGNKNQKFDPATVSAGQAAFERDCTTCHDAARSLERTKDLAGWLATVRRMAGKMGAEVATGDIEPIATYLASRNPAASASEGGKAAASTDTSSVSTFATLSPMYRGGNDHVQNPDFGPLAFVGGVWQGNVVSARVTLCITCHGVKEGGQISRVEPLEAAIHWDFSHYLDCHVEGMKGGLDAGRFVVPFGAFSAQVNPGLYYTVSPPLIFNMGERIYASDLGFPVLPMPDADTGIDLNASLPVCCGPSGPITATMDAYAVNGLQGTTVGVDFLETRSLLDNNNRIAGGARVTLGDKNIRAGASIMGGRFDDPLITGIPDGLDYQAYGFDIQARYERLVRCQFEYARRDSDRFGFVNNGLNVFEEAVFGYYAEIEVRHCNESKVSFLMRYDSQSRHSPSPPPGSSLPCGTFDVERLTFGVNIELWRQSLLMIDLEHWLLPEPDKRIANIGGVRYAITF